MRVTYECISDPAPENGEDHVEAINEHEEQPDVEGVVGEAGGVDGQGGEEEAECATTDEDRDDERPHDGDLEQG